MLMRWGQWAYLKSSAVIECRSPSRNTSADLSWFSMRFKFLIMHFKFHPPPWVLQIHLTLCYPLQLGRSTMAQLNKSLAFLPHLRIHEDKKNTLSKRDGSLNCPLFWADHTWEVMLYSGKDILRGRGGLEKQVAIQRRSSDLVRG